MIHQFIFTNPKPGMSVADFQKYWLEVHAVEYASKIPYIRRYRIDTVVRLDGKIPLFNGVAEIWLENEDEQIKSMQSKEFLEGARRDEPKWAAFWETVVIDTDTHAVLEKTEGTPAVQLSMLVKRKEGIPLSVFRNYSMNVHAPLVRKLPGIKGYAQCYARDTLYLAGESRFDCVYQLWFDDVKSVSNVLNGGEYKVNVEADLFKFIEQKWLFAMVSEEHWIIGPEFVR